MCNDEPINCEARTVIRYPITATTTTYLSAEKSGSIGAQMEPDAVVIDNPLRFEVPRELSEMIVLSLMAKMERSGTSSFGLESSSMGESGQVAPDNVLVTDERSPPSHDTLSNGVCELPF